MGPTLPIEPRDDRRLERRLRVELRFPAAKLGPGGELIPLGDVHACDLSLGGVGLVAKLPVESGDAAVIQVVGRSGAPSLVGLRIIHVEQLDAEGMFRLGARFIHLEKSVIRRWLTRADGVLIDLREYSADRLRRAS